MNRELKARNRRMFPGMSAQTFSGAVFENAVAAPSAAGPLREPAVIGYRNTKGVAVERVAYPAGNLGTAILANLVKPADFDADRKYAAIVVTHPPRQTSSGRCRPNRPARHLRRRRLCSGQRRQRDARKARLDAMELATRSERQADP